MLTSILIPTNNIEFLKETLKSIRLQKQECQTILVLDNIEINRDFWVENFKDINLEIFESSGNGISDALNMGIELCKGEYIFRIDSDDLMFPKRIWNQLKFMVESPDFVAIGGQMIAINASGESLYDINYPTDSKSTKAELLYHSAIPHPGACIRKKALLKVGGYRSFFPHVEDWDLWLRLMEHGELTNISEYVTKYRIHSNQITRLNEINMHASKEAVLCSKFLRARGKVDSPSISENLQNWISDSYIEIRKLNKIEDFALRKTEIENSIITSGSIINKFIALKGVLKLCVVHPYLSLYLLYRKFVNAKLR